MSTSIVPSPLIPTIAPVRDAKEARERIKAAKAGLKLTARAANARAAEAVLKARQWAEAVSLVYVPRAVGSASLALAKATDAHDAAKAKLDSAARSGTDAQVESAILTAMDANAVRQSVRSDVVKMGADPSLTGAVVCALISHGLVSPAALRARLGGAKLCASVAHDVASAKAELTAALDAQAAAKAALDAAAAKAK